MNLSSNANDNTLKEKELERLAMEKERNAMYESFQDQIDEAIDATADFVSGDEAGFDRIKRRNLLDRTQQMLAMKLNLSTSKIHASRAWRNELGPSVETKLRLSTAKALLLNNLHLLGEADKTLLNSDSAMTLISELFPKVRLEGDRVAHGTAPRGWYEGAVTRSKDRATLQVLLEFVTAK